MTNITVKKQIKASPQRVFETLTDFSRLTDVVSAIKSVELLTDGPLGMGTRYRETRVMFGREASEEMEITEFNPPTSFVLEADNHGAHYRTVRTVESAGEESIVTVTFGATATNFFARIMVTLMAPLMKKSLVRCLQQDLAEIKQHLESGS